MQVTKIYRLTYRPEDKTEADTQTRSLAGLAVVLAVLVVSLIVVKVLGHAARVEDCMLQGRTNCDLVVAKRI